MCRCDPQYRRQTCEQASGSVGYLENGPDLLYDAGGRKAQRAVKKSFEAYGYRRMQAARRHRGFVVNHKKSLGQAAGRAR